jgi:DNA invertase Pin-like site-specific DNA recombinase
MAADRGWRVVGEYVDVGQSGAKESRPELDRMMEAVRGGKVDVAAVARFDRFGRSVRHLLTGLEEFRKADVDFVSLSESIDTSNAVGKMVFTFLGAVAEFERALIVERVHAGIAKAKADGKHCGRPARPLDTRAARTLLGQGHSLRQVCEMLSLPRTTLARKIADEDHQARGPKGHAGKKR